MLIELTITNTGRTLARDVSFKVEPPFETTLDKSRGNLMELNLFKKPIPTLAPGKEVKVLFDHFPNRLGASLPMTYTVTTSYSDPDGRVWGETTPLDLDVYVGTGSVTMYDVHDVHARLKEIAGSVKRWTDSGGLKVLTRQDMKDRRAEREETLRREAEERKRAGDSNFENQ